MISVTGLTKVFDGYKALENVTCQIPEGCIYGMVGSNGAGKSTFLRLITGVYKADGGKVEIDGQPVYENPAIKNIIAFVPDDLFFINNASMKRMAVMYSRYYENFDMERFNFLTETFKLNPNKSLNTFSKGMRRQVSIILALSQRPEFLLCDEGYSVKFKPNDFYILHPFDAHGPCRSENGEKPYFKKVVVKVKI